MTSFQEPLKILSLDGGGIRGLSSLLILEDIMEKIRDKNGLRHVPRPCELFDLIGGTSTGGVIAIMLGRLGMTVNECIREYREFARQAFTPDSTCMTTSNSPSEPTFSVGRFEDAIKSTIRKFCPNCKGHLKNGHSAVQICPHENMLFRDETCTKTVVFAITKDDIDAYPTLFKTYNLSTAFESCTIWEVARATTAAVGFFDSIKLGRDEIEFIDASFGYNNPCEILIQEGRKQFPDRQSMRILSIGAGLGDVITIEDSPASVIKSLRDMATSSRRVARNLDVRFDGDSQYFRFNVDQGLKDITLSDWEKASRISAHTHNYLAENERAIRKFIHCLFGNVSAGEHRRLEATEATHFAVPFGRNRCFVGRESIMEELLKIVPPNVDTDDCQKTAIVGLGGVGKTQIALEIAFRIHEKHSNCSVFWIPAIDAVNFRNAYRMIGQFLRIDGINDDKADVEKLVKRVLSSENAGSWLMIVDNIDNPDPFDGSTNLARYFPSSRQGSLLFTSRNRELVMELGVPALNVFTVEGMTEHEGFKFLEMHLTKHQMSNRKDTTNLLEVLGYLPLAIRQASAYMAKKQISTTRYLEHCRSSDKRMIELLSRDFEDSHRYKEAQNPIATTWLISFRYIADQDPLAADYLKFMCFLSEKAIPRSLLPDDAWSLEAEDAIGTLKAYAFITEREAPDKFDIHQLVRLAMLNWLEKQRKTEMWTAKVIRRLDGAFPTPSHENKAVWMCYLPHTRHVLDRQTTAEVEQGNLLFKVGCSFEILGQYREADLMHRRALEKREKVLGYNHPDTLDSIDNLGIALEKQGQYERAEAMHRRALEGREKVLGQNHSATLASVSNLGVVLHKQGKYELAEGMHRRALEGREKALGPHHLDTLVSVSNLGKSLRRQGKYERAEAMHRRELEGREKELGPNHPDTLEAVQNLGSALRREGKYDQAESMYWRALEGQEKVLGPDHPKTLVSVNNLGNVFESQGQYERAEAMHQRALEGRKKVLGSDHPSTLTSINNLGIALEGQGQYERAETMYRLALARREKVLGPDHPKTLASINNLGVALHKQGQYVRAEAVHRQALEGREKVLGPDHIDTLGSVSNLGNALRRQGKYELAEAMHRRALHGRQKELGPNHPDTLGSFYNLGNALQKQGKYEHAENMHQCALEGREKVLGPNHPKTLASINNLGVVLECQGQYERAEAMHRRALQSREKVLGLDHPKTLSSVNYLGNVLHKQGRHEEAEVMYRRALEGRKRVLGPDHPDTLTSLANLGIVLESQGRYEKAEELYRRALEGRQKVLGPDHPDTIASVNSLAGALQRRGNHDRAEPMVPEG
ncbi:hypothetical protein VTN49DRAFT_1741 [Thermomyces lanuginosus]|uniref:uncharacterized protein n=1 Tax=Thermomyces lanuginosus TaxID=5541 RepID=UPI003743D736